MPNQFEGGLPFAFSHVSFGLDVRTNGLVITNQVKSVFAPFPLRAANSPDRRQQAVHRHSSDSNDHHVPSRLRSRKQVDSDPLREQREQVSNAGRRATEIDRISEAVYKNEHIAEDS
ncbi:MAG: hypothetical protein BroJett009_09380 [Armatimonadota bacterium]|nr:MAG: hypothetical protein BroJett009_09380 [Armatimonadota bacterium]